MSFITSGIVSCLFQNNVNKSRLLSETCKVIQVRCYAARKGTRDRKTKKKVKVEIEKVGFIPHNQRNKDKFLLNRQTRKFDDSWKRDPIDDVYVCKYYKWIVYPFAEAVQCHWETHHPDIYNKPDANLHVSVELNMQGEKQTRFVDNFSRVAAVPHKFEHGEERAILAFAKTTEDHSAAMAAGAQLAGGSDLIRQIQNGQVTLNDFQYICAHPNILPELVVLRGIMKRRFPNPKSGTLDPELGKVVDRLFNGINYMAMKDEFEKDFGVIETVIGTLNMDSKHLEENFSALINDIHTMKPKRNGTFITRCLLWSPPSQEKLKIGHEMYLESQQKDKKSESKNFEDEEEEIAEKIAL